MEGLKEYNIAILSVNGLDWLLGAHSLTTEAKNSEKLVNSQSIWLRTVFDGLGQFGQPYEIVEMSL